MYRIRKLEVRRFRGLAAPVTLEFGDRYHLIIGDNGAGKTNLLRLLAMVTRMDFSPLAEESFDLSWEGGTDEGDVVKGRVEREVLPPTPVSARATRVRWDWEVLSTTFGQFPVCERDEGLSGSGADPARPGGILSLLFASSELTGLLDFLGQRSHRADEAVDTFKALTAGEVGDGAEGIPVFEPTVAFAGNEPIGEFDQEWMDAAARGEYREVTTDTFPWLEASTRELGAERLRLRPRFLELRPSALPGNREIIAFRGCDITVTFSPKVAVHHDKLSFGQKRLLGLRYYLSTTEKAPAIIDELSNGLHHAWVEAIVRDLEPRQSFLATQSPLLMDAVWWDSAEEAGKGIVLCTRDAEHRWVWRQLDAEERVRFYDAWRAGVQQIHEVLKTEGWW